jgi:hypothetical protein
MTIHTNTFMNPGQDILNLTLAGIDHRLFSVRQNIRRVV